MNIEGNINNTKGNGESVRVQLENKIEELNEEHLISIDLNISEEERAAIDGFEIQEMKNSEVVFCSDSFADTKGSVNKYLSNLEMENDTGSIEGVSEVIARSATEFKDSVNGESVLVIVRVQGVEGPFEIPRWHTDGKYSASNTIPFKLVASLRGSQTRFAQINDRKEFGRLEMSDYPENAPAMTELVEEVFPAHEGQAVIYRVGDENAVAHSEPESLMQRIFYSVVVGTKEEMQDWADQKNS
jgi:hypothetical protein